MSLLSDLKSIISSLNIPVKTGAFDDNVPDLYIVLVPIDDEFALHADNRPGVDVQSVRISLYAKKNYTEPKNRVIKALIGAGMTITSRQYIGFEQDTKYHHYNIDVENVYEMEEL
jgi:hypothetical protein